MQFDKGYLSPYFCTDAEAMEVILENPHILLFEKKVSAICRTSCRCCRTLQNPAAPLLIIAEDVEGEALGYSRRQQAAWYPECVRRQSPGLW